MNGRADPSACRRIVDFTRPSGAERKQTAQQERDSHRVPPIAGYQKHIRRHAGGCCNRRQKQIDGAHMNRLED